MEKYGITAPPKVMQGVDDEIRTAVKEILKLLSNYNGDMGKERIFARPRTIIGRQVQNCHPLAGMHIVERIIDNLRQAGRNMRISGSRLGKLPRLQNRKMHCLESLTQY